MTLCGGGRALLMVAPVADGLQRGDSLGLVGTSWD